MVQVSDKELREGESAVAHTSCVISTPSEEPLQLNHCSVLFAGGTAGVAFMSATDPCNEGVHLGAAIFSKPLKDDSRSPACTLELSPREEDKDLLSTQVTAERATTPSRCRTAAPCFGSWYLYL